MLLRAARRWLTQPCGAHPAARASSHRKPFSQESIAHVPKNQSRHRRARRIGCTGRPGLCPDHRAGRSHRLAHQEHRCHVHQPHHQRHGRGNQLDPADGGGRSHPPVAGIDPCDRPQHQQRLGWWCHHRPARPGPQPHPGAGERPPFCAVQPARRGGHQLHPGGPAGACGRVHRRRFCCVRRRRGGRRGELCAAQELPGHRGQHVLRHFRARRFQAHPVRPDHGRQLCRWPRQRGFELGQNPHRSTDPG
jgi:hypothetical protein